MTGFTLCRRLNRGISVAWLTMALLLALLLGAPPARAAIDLEVLATRIANSLKLKLTDPSYRTVAISRIKNAGGVLDVDELIDFTNVKIVRMRHLRVIDRSKLQLILNEQKVQLSDFVSAEKYQELGKLMGVDLFIYGSFHQDALVLKGIDVQNSAIAWAEVFPIKNQPKQAAYLSGLGKGVIDSLQKDESRLRKANIRLLSFWDIKTSGQFTPKSVMDYLSVYITNDRRFKVVDRENLKLITEEQQLNQAVYINEKSAKQLGELYGVDAFIYGGIKRRSNGTYLASLKMLNIYNGVIEWADLIEIRPAKLAGMAPAPSMKGKPNNLPSDMAQVPGGAFIMGQGDRGQLNGPTQQVRMKPFFIDITEVSNRDYAKFVKERKHREPVGWSGGQYPSGRSNHPVVGISWEDARQYCRYAGKRLPLEIEWEKAARGTSGQPYPWQGNTFSPGFAITRESGRKATVQVHSAGRDISPYGVKNMAGNVREWVEDLLRPYPGSAAQSSKFKRERVLRGGSWATDQRAALAAFRGSSKENLAWQDVGFRCVKSR